MALNNQILWASLLGIGLGVAANWLGSASPAVIYGLQGCKLLSGMFVGLLKMLMVPLVLASITVGVANLRLHSRLHRVWRLTLLFFIGSMLLAIAQGLLAANLLQPGKGLTLALLQHSSQLPAARDLSLGQFLSEFVAGLFVNPFAADRKSVV